MEQVTEVDEIVSKRIVDQLKDRATYLENLSKKLLNLTISEVGALVGVLDNVPESCTAKMFISCGGGLRDIDEIHSRIEENIQKTLDEINRL